MEFYVVVRDSGCHYFDIPNLSLVAGLKFVNKAFHFLVLIIVEVTIFQLVVNGPKYLLPVYVIAATSYRGRTV